MDACKYLRVFNAIVHDKAVEQEKRYFIYTGNHILSCSLYKHTDNDVFDDFTKISEHFPKVLQKFFEGHTNVFEHFPKGNWRLPKTFEEDTKMFRAYTNKLNMISVKS